MQRQLARLQRCIQATTVLVIPSRLPPNSQLLTALTIIVTVALMSSRVLIAAPFSNPLHSQLCLAQLYPSHLGTLTVVPLVRRISCYATMGASLPEFHHGRRHGHMSSLHLLLLSSLS